MNNRVLNITFKLLLGTLITLLVLAGGLRLAMKSSWVHDKIRSFAVAKVQDHFDADFRIGHLAGDLWKELALTEMEFSLGDQYLSIDSLSVNYSLSDVLFGVREVDAVVVTGVQLKWNQQTAVGLFPERDSTETEKNEPIQFAVNNFTLKDTKAEIFAPDQLPDSSLTIQEFKLQASFQYFENPELWLKQLSFRLKSGSLPDPVKFSVEGALKDEEITLNNLIVETGRTLLKAQLEAKTNGDNVQGTVSSTPLALQDFASFVDMPLADQDVELQLKIGGSINELFTTLIVNHPSLQNSEITAAILLTEEPALTSFIFQSSYINASTFLPELPPSSVKNVTISTHGKLPFTGIESSELEWSVSAEEVRYDTLQIKKAASTGRLNGGKVTGTAELISMADERVTFSGEVEEVFSDSARWQTSASVRRLDLRNWIEDAESTNISLFAKVQGFGYNLPEDGWTYSLGNQNPKTGKRVPIKFGDITINILGVNGEFGITNTSVSGLLRLKESKVRLDADLHGLLSQNVEHNYSLSLEHVNVSELMGSQDFNTDINGLISSSGVGNDIENLRAAGSIDLDESTINGALLRNFSGEFSLADGILNINNGELKSEIADGSIDGRKNLMDISDTENRLSMDLILKDPQPFAPLAGLTVLQGKGELTGEILQDATGALTSDFQLNLTDIQLDTLLTAPAISGRAYTLLSEKSAFELHFNVSEPVISGMPIQDVTLEMDGEASDTELDAAFQFEVISSKRGRLEQRGTIHSLIHQEITDVEFTAFDFISEQSIIRLQEPFHIRLAEELFGTDTLKLASNNGAYMNLIIPYASPIQQKVISSGSNFDVGLIQDILFGQRFVEGIVSGAFDFNKDGQIVTGVGNLDFVQVNYQGVQADSIKLGYNIANQRLKLRGGMFWEASEQIRGTVEIPFVLEESLIDDEFFRRKVNGELSVKPTSLERFGSLMEAAGLQNTTGIISFNGSISGTAGNPNFTGELEIEDPVLSGISIDEILTRFNYSNTNKKLRIQSEIFALGATMAELEIAYPIDYDFKAYKFNDMAQEDEIEIFANSTELDLALFNDFLDPKYMSRLSGRLNADLKLTGTLGDITPNGFVDLKNTRVQMPYQGITVRNMSAKVNVEKDLLNIENISAESGPGSFSAKGALGLDGIYPTTINVKTQARRFQLSNTADLNLLINMDATMKGEAIRPKLAGRIDVQSGFYYVADFGNEYLEEVTLEGEEVNTFSPFDSLSMEMILSIEDNFFVRSRSFVDAELEVTGELDMVKETGGDLQLFGSLEANEGYIKPLSKRFELEASSIGFSGPYDNPDLDIRSSYTPQTRQKGESVILYYVITGDAKNQEYKFESDPYMEQSDIICYTLFNKPCYSLDSWQSVIAGNSSPNAMAVLTDVLLDQVESLATRELGVDVVQIDNSGASGATAIKTGWYLNERTFFAIVNEITNSTPKTLFILEYILSENWDLIVTQGDDDRQGIDIRYQFDY